MAKPWRDMTKRERALYANAASSFYAAGYGKQPRLVDVPPERAPRAKPVLREAAILRDVLSLLYRHPKCAVAYRQNAGTFGEHFVRLGPRGICDIIGMLKDGRYLAIEIKAPGKKPEQHQFTFMQMVNDNGGLAGWVTSIDEAIAFMDRA